MVIVILLLPSILCQWLWVYELFQGNFFKYTEVDELQIPAAESRSGSVKEELRLSTGYYDNQIR